MTKYTCCLVDKASVDFRRGWDSAFITAETPKEAALAYCEQYNGSTHAIAFVQVATRKAQTDQDGNMYDYWFFELERSWRILP